MTKPTCLQSQQMLRTLQAKAELEMYYRLSVEDGVKLLSALSSGTAKSSASIGTQPFHTKSNDAA